MTFDLTRLFADIVIELDSAKRKHPRDKAIPFVHPDTYSTRAANLLELHRKCLAIQVHFDAVSHEAIISTELAEAIAETDPVKRRAELIQVLATVIRSIEDIESEMP